MNPYLQYLQPYPFARLEKLFSDIDMENFPGKQLKPIRLSMGEPQHATPELIQQVLKENMSGLARYPQTSGTLPLRQSIAAWLQRRYHLPSVDPNTQVLPVNGSREALFAIAQCLINNQTTQPLVLMPNPFYQIYEGAALLAGAQPIFYTTGSNPAAIFTAANNNPQQPLVNTQLVYVCSPGNPTGEVLSLQAWQELFDWSERNNFVIVSDECYSEIYFDEANPPLGGLQAAQQLGRGNFKNLLVVSSLSKRSNVPGLRSGFVAGDAQLIREFLRYRTYHGCAMSPPIQQASIAAWNDEEHVKENRSLYAEKFKLLHTCLRNSLEVEKPAAGFYFWAKIPKHLGNDLGDDDPAFAQNLFYYCNLAVLPGSFLARKVNGHNPGSGYVRIALVASLEDCRDAVNRIQQFCQQFNSLTQYV